MEPDGTRERATFNDNGYPLSDTTAVGEPNEVAVRYDRDARTNLVSAVTARCTSADGAPRTLRAPTAPGWWAADATAEELTRQCRAAGAGPEDSAVPSPH